MIWLLLASALADEPAEVAPTEQERAEAAARPERIPDPPPPWPAAASSSWSSITAPRRDWGARFETHRATATLGVPFWAAGTATLGWVTLRTFHADFEPLRPEVTGLLWIGGVGLAWGGAFTTGWSSLKAMEAWHAGDPPPGDVTFGRASFGMLAGASSVLLAEAVVLWMGGGPPAGLEQEAEALALGAVSVGTLAGVPAVAQWLRNLRLEAPSLAVLPPSGDRPAMLAVGGRL